MSNTIRQIAPKYWIVYGDPDANADGDTVTGVIVWLENGCYVPYVDDLPTVAFANRDAVIEYVGVLAEDSASFSLPLTPAG